MDKKLKLLLVATTFPRWKGDKLPPFIYYFARYMSDEFEVHVITPHSKGAKKNENMDNIHVHRFIYMFPKMERFGSGLSIFTQIKRNKFLGLLIPFFLFFGYINILALQLKYRFNIIHVHWFIPFGPFVAILRKILNFKFVITSHGSDVYPFSNNQSISSNLVSKVNRYITLPLADQITVVSSALKKHLLAQFPNISADKIKIMSMGINYDVFNKPKEGLSKNHFNVIFVGRLVEFKGVIYLIEGIKKLILQGLDIYCNIYGEGQLRSELEKKTIELGLQNRVIFHGFIDNEQLPSKLWEGNVFIAPSIETNKGESEGLGLTILEAMAAGLPVIASNVGGIPDIVKHENNGLLVEQKNPEEIADAIKRLMQDDDLRKLLIRNSSKFSREYAWSNITRKYQELYSLHCLNDRN